LKKEQEMVEYLWDGEMDCGWEDLGEKVVDISSKFVDNLLNLISFSYNEEAIKLITEESLGRFQNLAKKLAEEIQNGYYCQYEDMENVISTIRNEFIAIAKSKARRSKKYQAECFRIKKDLRRDLDEEIFSQAFENAMK